MSTLSQLPVDSSLFIATPSAVHAYSRSKQCLLFECATDGIVNARPARDNSSLLAVADSHLVVLHDAARRNDRKYMLKSIEGEPRLLLFSPDSRTLFFSTTLSTTIQAYCIPTGELLPPPQIHSSPPNILAISADGNILLSASPSPPTILVQDLRLGGSASVNVRPTHANSPAVFATFRPDDKYSNLSSVNFLLGFGDGTLSMYRLSLPSRRPSYVDAYLNSNQAFQLQPTKLASIRKLHKAAMGGITAAEFIPGYKSRVVSIGHDGRCRLVDFEDGGRVLRTWHVSAPATCLSVTSRAVVMSRGRRDRHVLLVGDSSRDNRFYEGMETLIAVGTQAGKVVVFNSIGLLVHEVEMDTTIVALEWIGDMSAPSVLPSRRDSQLLFEQRTQTMARTIFGNHDSSSENEVEMDQEGTVKRTKIASRQRINRSPVRLDGVRDLFSPASHGHLRRKQADPSNGSPMPVNRMGNRPKRTSFIRPRIVTETFKSPTLLPQSRHASEDLHRAARLTVEEPTAAHKELLRQTSREVYDIFLQDAIRDPNSSSEYSPVSESEAYMTPPTSFLRVEDHRSERFDGGVSYHTVLVQATDPASPPASSRRSFLTRSPELRAESPPPIPEKSTARMIPRGNDFRRADQGWMASWEDRSPFPAPPGRQKKDDDNYAGDLDEKRTSNTTMESKEEAADTDEEQPKQQRPSGREARKSPRAQILSRDFAISNEAEDNEQRRRARTQPDRPQSRPKPESREAAPRRISQDGYDALRQDMAMLREEFRALREAVLVSRKE